MMAVNSIDLIYFSGCPNAEAARANLRAALEAARLPAAWHEWNLDEPHAPECVRQYGSPTILVNGRDVAGPNSGGLGRACRTDGAPSIHVILSALTRFNPPRAHGASPLPARPWPRPLLTAGPRSR